MSFTRFTDFRGDVFAQEDSTNHAAGRLSCEREFQELFQIEAFLSHVAPRLLGYSSLPEFLLFAVCSANCGLIYFSYLVFQNIQCRPLNICIKRKKFCGTQPITSSLVRGGRIRDFDLLTKILAASILRTESVRRTLSSESLSVTGVNPLVTIRYRKSFSVRSLFRRAASRKRWHNTVKCTQRCLFAAVSEASTIFLVSNQGNP